MVIESIHIVWLVVFGLITLISGTVAGFLLSKIRYHSRMEELIDSEQKIRQQRVELQRLSYQESVAKINQTNPSESDEMVALEKLLEQREHDFSILQQETALEIQFLKEKNEQLQEELNEFQHPSYQFEHRVEPGLFEDLVVGEIAEEVMGASPEFSEEEPQRESAHEANENDKEEHFEEIYPEEQFDVDVAPDPDELPNLVDEDETISADDFQFHWTPAPSLEKETLRNEDTPAETSAPVSINPIKLPTFKQVGDLLPEPLSDSPPWSPTIQDLPGLGPDQFELLTDLGYATPERLSVLNDEEIAQLASIFRISESTIKDEWMPVAKKISNQNQR